MKRLVERTHYLHANFLEVLVSGSASLTKGTYYYYEMIHTESTTEVDVTMRAYLKESQYNYNQTSKDLKSFEWIWLKFGQLTLEIFAVIYFTPSKSQC